MHPDKIAVVIRQDLKSWQKLNTVAFLASGLAIQFPGLHGQPLVTASGNTYLPFLKQPVLLYQAGGLPQLMRAFNRAKERNLHTGIFTSPLFDTKTEEENLAAIACCTDDEQDLVGIIIYGDTKKVNKATDGLSFHE